MALTIRYLAGYGRSGSTALDVTLSQPDDTFSLGEATYLFEHLRAGRTCACGELFGDCEFWHEFIQDHLAMPISEQARLERLYRRLDAGLLRGNQKHQAIEFQRKVLSYASRRSGCEILVDSSKSSRKSWYRAVWLDAQPDVTVRPYLLVRNPLVVARVLYKNTNPALIDGTAEPSLRRGLRSFVGWFLANGLALVTLNIFFRRRWSYHTFRQTFPEHDRTLFPTLDSDHGIVGSRHRLSNFVKHPES